MKNRIKTLLITMLTALYCCGIVVPVSAETLGDKCGENVTWSYDEETQTLTISGSGDMYNYSFAVNETINNLPPWSDKRLSKIVIEDGVTSVGNCAFAGECNSPEEKVDVTISGSIKKIGKSAFSAKNIENCVINNGVELIEKGAFSNSSVKKLIIPPSVKCVETDAFFLCDVEQVHITDLAAWCQIDFANDYANPMFYHVSPTADLNEEDYFQKGLYLNGEFVSMLEMPDGIEKIGKYAFAGCKSILGVIFSQSVKDIGEWAFYSCNDMFGVYIPKEVETIGTYAFASCPALKFLSWEVVETESGNSNLKTIGDSAFEDCPILENVTIPAGVERVGMRAFAENKNLKSLTISENVGVIGESAFENCNNLETVTISSGLKKIEKNAFYGDVRTKVYIDDLSSWCSIDFENEYSNPLSNTERYDDGLYLNNEPVEKLVIPEDVTSVGSYAFYDAECIKEIELPENIQNIGGYAFHNTGFFNNSENWEAFDTTGYDDLDYDFLYIGDCLIATTFGAVRPRSNGLLNEYNDICTQFKPGTRIIGGAAFASCDGLTDVIIPESVERICDSAFENCEMLEEVEIPNTVEIDTERMFSGCKKLERVNIPNGVKKIGDKMFSGCVMLKDVTIPSTVKEIGDEAFCDCVELKRVNIPNGVEKIGDRMFSGCVMLKNVTIPSTVKEIGDEAFYDCEVLEDIDLPSGLTSIGAGAFKNTWLYSINIPGGVKEIGEEAFMLSALEGGVVINNGVEKIGECAFSNTGITSITIPESVKEIGHSAFENCSDLESVTIPGSVKDIGRFAFCSCTSLEYVMIPEGVEIIDDHAFDKCKSLTEVYVPKSITYIGEYAFGGSESVMSKLYYAGSETNWKSVFVGEDCVAEDVEVIYNFKGVRAYTFEDGFGAKLNVVTSGIDKGATVIFAKYDGKKFLGMDSKVYDGKMLSFDNDYSEGKIMAWSDLENITPITSAYDVTYLK